MARNKSPLKILIINNRTHGMVRQFQQELLRKPVPIDRVGLQRAGFAAVAEAYGIRSARSRAPDRARRPCRGSWPNPDPPSSR